MPVCKIYREAKIKEYYQIKRSLIKLNNASNNFRSSKYVYAISLICLFLEHQLRLRVNELNSLFISTSLIAKN